MYPEFRLAEAQRVAWLRDRQGVVVGRKLAQKFGWQLGDRIPLRGTIYAGTWNFTLRGIYEGADAGVDENQMLMQWAYINEAQRARGSRGGDRVGVFVVGIDDPNNAALISQRGTRISVPRH